MFQQHCTGDIADIANNVDGVYEGNLRYYFKIIIEAPNIHNGYHGLRHMLHVTWVCYKACIYYGKLNQMTPQQMRNLLIAALFHDYDHTGEAGDDSVNIKRAIAGLRKHVLFEDEPYLEEIIAIFQATQFPHSDLGDTATLEQLIIRDADISQAFDVSWIGEIVSGFGNELNKSPKEMLEQQLKFLDGISFYTDFGKVFYGDHAVVAKRNETEQLLHILVPYVPRNIKS